MFDTKCAELAVHFLGTDVSDATVAALAQEIQNAVEDWMSDPALSPVAPETPAAPACDHRRIRDGAAGMGKVCRDCGMLGTPTRACTWR